MRIVLKPGGVVLVILLMAELTYLATGEMGKKGKQPQNTAGSAAKGGFSFGGKMIVATPSTGAGEAGAMAPNLPMTNLLYNGDFESGFIVARPDNTKPIGHVKGSYGSGWTDSSTWADLTVAYEPDQTNPHSGRTCQRISVSDRKNGQAQFIQYTVPLLGKQVHGSIWVRAESANTVQLILRDGTEYSTTYVEKDFDVSTDWQKIEVQGKVTKPNAVAFLLAVRNPGTVWVDDASMEVVP